MGPKKATPTPAAVSSSSGGGGKEVVNEVGIGLSASLYATTTTLPFKGLTVKLFSHHNIIETSTSPVFGEALAWTEYATKNDNNIGSVDGGDDALTSSTSTKRSPTLVATYTWPNVDLSTVLKDTDKMTKFHGSSGIYAVLMGKRTDVGDDSEVPIAFAYVDCSIFMLEGGKSTGRSQSVDGGLLLELTVTAVHPQVPKETAFTYDPLVLQISQLGGYPVLIDEMEGEALDSVYVYGKLDMGAFSKTIFTRPLRAMSSIATQATSKRGSFSTSVSNIRGSFSSKGNIPPPANENSSIRGSISVPNNNLGSTRMSVSFTGENIPALAAFLPPESDVALDALSSSPEGNMASIEQKLCMLPGLSDMATFRESLASATFVLQIHREDIQQRAFCAKHVEEWRAVCSQSAADKKSAPAKGKHSEGGLSPPDAFLVACIDTAMTTASQVSPYGTARFRLTEMLSSSVDLLKEFAMKRQQGLITGLAGQGSDTDQGQGLGQGLENRRMSTVPGAVGGEGQGQDRRSFSIAPNHGQDKGLTDTTTMNHEDNGMVVQEDMLLEIHLAKPSKPPKVAKPSDFSLRAVLQRAQGELGEMGSPGGLFSLSPASFSSPIHSPMMGGQGGGGGGGGDFTPSRKGSSPQGRSSPTLTTQMSSQLGATSQRSPTTTLGGMGGSTVQSPHKKHLAGTLLGRGVVPCSLIRSKPRYEQFFECGTRLMLSATFHRCLQHPHDPPSALPIELFKMREQRQHRHHFSALANRTEAAIGFTSTMIPKHNHNQTVPFGTIFPSTGSINGHDEDDNMRPPPSTTTISMYPTPMQLRGSSLGLEFDTINFDLLMSEGLKTRLAVTPFTRMVVIFRYDDDDTLIALNEAIGKVNRKALEDFQGSLRSYAFSPEEVVALVSGAMDVVTGIMIIDDDTRMVVLEGLAKPGGGMQSIYMDLPRPKENDQHFKMLCNPELLFSDRLYPHFGPEVKRIRLRDKLKKLARRPELYNRKQVDEVCFEAFDMLMTLRRSMDLQSTKDLRMYPTAESLNTLELLYGEAVSRADLDGLAAEAHRQAMLEQKRLEKIARAKGDHSHQHGTVNTHGSASASADNTSGGGSTRGVEGVPSSSTPIRSPHKHPPSFTPTKDKNNNKTNNNTPTHGKHPDTSSTAPADDENHLSNAHSVSPKKTSDRPSSNKTNNRPYPSDCRNEAFEEYLRTRPENRVNIMEQTKELRRQAWLNMLERREHREQEYTETMAQVFGKDAAAQANIFMYSTQSLNFKDIAMTKMRERLSQVKNSTFTFNRDFNSQTMCMVDLEKNEKDMAEQSRAEWLTKKGFRYPATKTRQDLITHPKRPTELTIADLKEPWTGDMLVPDVHSDPEEKARQLLLEKGYSTKVTLGGNLFGGLTAPEYARSFELKLVGDRKHLPRGVLVSGTRQDTDESFFKSVHLGGTQQAQIIADAIQKEKEDWAAKVVVDSTTFRVGHLSVRDKPIQMERAGDILHDEPARRDLKTLRYKTSKSTGKLITYEVPPLSMFNEEPYAPTSKSANVLGREEDRTRFVTTGDLAKTGRISGPVTKDSVALKDVDFTRYLHRHAHENAKLHKIVATRKHPPQDRTSAECTGPKWHHHHQSGSSSPFKSSSLPSSPMPSSQTHATLPHIHSPVHSPMR